MKRWQTHSLLLAAASVAAISVGCQTASVQGADQTPATTTAPATAAANAVVAPPMTLPDVPALAADVPAAPDAFWGDWAAGSDPTAVGKLIVQNFLDREKKGDKSIDSKAKNIGYPEGCTAYGSMRFTNTIGEKDQLNALVAKYEKVVGEPGTPGSRMNKPSGEDAEVCALVPLEMYLVTGKKEYLDTGKDYADAQFDAKFAKEHFKVSGEDYLASPKNGGTHPPEGLSWQTRYWVDDMFMITGVELQAYRATNDTKYLDRAAVEMASYLDKLQQPNGLFFHRDVAQHYWGRGNGWFAVGMAEMLSSLPADHPQRARILDGYKKMMAALQKFQAADGSWHQLIDDEKPSWPESSCTAMFTFAEAMGVKNGWLDDSYKATARNGWIAVTKFLDKDANMTEVCVGTNTSADPSYYLKRNREVGNLHGQAAAIWAAWAMIEEPKK